MAPQIVHITVVCILFISQVHSQISNDLDVGDIEKKINGIPGLETFNSSKLPDEEDLQRMLKEKCEKNGGGEEAYNALKNQQTKIQECLQSQLNMTQIQLEVEEAKKTGSMDEVFGKYCKKYPEVHACFEEVTDQVRPCLDLAEQDTLNKTLKIVQELKDFVCFKDGDRIAMFIAEGGVECLESKKEEVQECANKTLGSRLPTDMSSVNSLPSFLFTDRDCNDFDKIRLCVNTELEKCKDSTPANIVDAFFKFLKKHMPCAGSSGTVGVGEAYSKENSASGITVYTSFIVVSVILSKFF